MPSPSPSGVPPTARDASPSRRRSRTAPSPASRTEPASHPAQSPRPPLPLGTAAFFFSGRKDQQDQLVAGRVPQLFQQVRWALLQLVTQGSRTVQWLMQASYWALQ